MTVSMNMLDAIDDRLDLMVYEVRQSAAACQSAAYRASSDEYRRDTVRRTGHEFEAAIISE